MYCNLVNIFYTSSNKLILLFSKKKKKLNSFGPIYLFHFQKVIPF